jgi:hypothetical protein
MEPSNYLQTIAVGVRTDGRNRDHGGGADFQLRVERAKRSDRKNALYNSMLKLPSRIGAAVPYLESDWVRYGVPAVLLTAIFFVSMRYKVEAPPSPPPTVAARNPVQRDHPLQMPMPQRAVVPTFPQPHRQMAMGAPPPDVQTEGRRALCIAVQQTLSGASKTYSKMNIMRFAVRSYRGEGGTRGAIRAVNVALGQYRSGVWSEAQCPPALGTAPLPKGAIAEAMR